MAQVIVVDGSGVCRAPIVEYMLSRAFAGISPLADVRFESRGLTAEAGTTMCEGAAARIGFTGSAIGFFGAYRAVPLSTADVARADLVLTAERSQRSSVVRLLPGTQSMVFTWKECLVLATVLADRQSLAGADGLPDLAGLVKALHGARGSVPLIEPAVRTGPVHWRRNVEMDPLSLASGHGGDSEHGRVTREARDIAEVLGETLVSLTGEHLARPRELMRPGRRSSRRSA